MQADVPAGAGAVTEAEVVEAHDEAAADAPEARTADAPEER